MLDNPPGRHFPAPASSLCCRLDLVLRRFAFRIAEHAYFETATLLVICANVVLVAMDYYNAPVAYANALHVAQNVVTFIFLGEMLVKWAAIGFAGYWRVPWNQFDGVMTLISVAEYVLFDSSGGGGLALGFDPTLLRLLRMLRVVRAVRYFATIGQLLRTLVFAAPAVGNVSMLALLVFYCYAVLGMAMFGKISVQRANAMGANGNFTNMIQVSACDTSCVVILCSSIIHARIAKTTTCSSPFTHSPDPTLTNIHLHRQALLLLFRCMTGEAWNGVMRDCAIAPPFCNDALGALSDASAVA